MGHNPVNHPLRPLYRALAALSGVYLIVFGVVGLIVTPGNGLFGQPDERVLGQGTSLFWAIVSLILGAIVLLATVIGRNIDTETNKYLAWGLMVIGSYELAVSRTDANILKFTIGTVIVVYIVALILLLASLYTKVAPRSEAGAPRQEREAAAHA